SNLSCSSVIPAAFAFGWLTAEGSRGASVWSGMLGPIERYRRCRVAKVDAKHELLRAGALDTVREPRLALAREAEDYEVADHRALNSTSAKIWSLMSSTVPRIFICRPSGMNPNPGSARVNHEPEY